MHTNEVIDRDPLQVAARAVGIVRSAIAPMLAEPHVSSGQVSQQLAGHRVEIVEDRGDWLLVRGIDDYEGWMHRGYLESVTQTNGHHPAMRVSLGCVVRDGTGKRCALPLRALVPAQLVVEEGDVITAEEVTARFPRAPEVITRSAMELFVGTGYQWGGVTPWGADCSGLVQSVFALHGVLLPRDAWQQARAGRDAGTDLFRLDVADLLFFSDRPDGHVTHVAISLGDGRVVHLALGRGGYAVESLDDRRDAYVEKLRRRFLFARRVL